MNLYCNCGNEITRKALELEPNGICCLECYYWLVQDRNERKQDNDKEI